MTDTPPADGAPAEGGTAQSWFDSEVLDADARGYLEAKGLNQIDDPIKAVAQLAGIGRAADRRFGRPVDSVIDKPSEGQSVAEWRRQNAAALGLPDAADAYEIKRPDGLPESIAWDGDLEARFRTVAHERGLSQDDVAALTGLYADQVQTLMTNADAEVERANAAMMAELQKSWGAETESRIAQAQQAAQVIGERAGLDAGGIQAVASVLTSKAGGDAAAVRFFAALGEMMGEDQGVGFGKGAASTMTAAEAQARLNEMRAPGGAFYEAKTARAREDLFPEIERLSKIAAGTRG